MRITHLFLAFFLLISYSYTNDQAYPDHWWQKIDETKKFGSWEILPHEAKPGELILSKRNELGIFSNLSFAPFILDGIRYASVEALWQGMKFPDPLLMNDPRNAWEYPMTREEVYQTWGFSGKRLGDHASKLMKKNEYYDVSYKGLPFNYKDMGLGSQFHYQIIKAAITAKVMQNPELITLLKKTQGLVLKPDHKIRDNSPPAYGYFKILMEIRDNLLEN